MFGSGPARRFIAEAGRKGIQAQQIIPGGQSGVPGSAFFGSMLGAWLTNDFHDALFSSDDVIKNRHSREEFAPR
jgi:penicillin amidase